MEDFRPPSPPCDTLGSWNGTNPGVLRTYQLCGPLSRTIYPVTRGKRAGAFRQSNSDSVLYMDNNRSPLHSSSQELDSLPSSLIDISEHLESALYSGLC